jgi:hypothetical protein
MHLIISAQDQVLARYGNALAALGQGQARAALSRALNHEGAKGRTQVKRALVKQSEIKYGAVDKAMATVRATPATLTYTLKARGDETNIAWFGGVGAALRHGPPDEAFPRVGVKTVHYLVHGMPEYFLLWDWPSLRRSSGVLLCFYSHMG